MGNMKKGKSGGRMFINGANQFEGEPKEKVVIICFVS